MSDDSAPQQDPMASMMMFQMMNADKQRAQDKIDAEEHKKELAALRDSSFSGALNSTKDYFRQLGLDPDQFGGSINTELQDILNSIAPTDENPGSYFKNAGQKVYGDLTASNQSRLQNDLDRYFAPNYETSKIGLTLDDPYLSGLDQEMRGNADAIIRNMVKRGVLTGTGATAAASDLDRQGSGVRGKLQSFGDALLAGGQTKLRDVANQARQAAGTVKLGQTFDPTQYTHNADQIFNDFVSSIGDQLRAKVPTNLYTTNGLAAVGGAAQGAGNTKYDPNAAAGIIQDDNDQSQMRLPAARESLF